ncbi:MAG: hypothetical protein RL417_1421 [Pseudomonadota bacterium]|jgi:hypothetical protein
MNVLRKALLVLVSVFVIVSGYFLFIFAPLYPTYQTPAPPTPLITESLKRSVLEFSGILGFVILIPLFWGFKWCLDRVLSRTLSVVLSFFIPLLSFKLYYSLLSQHPEKILVWFGLLWFFPIAAGFYIQLSIELYLIVFKKSPPQSAKRE